MSVFSRTVLAACLACNTTSAASAQESRARVWGAVGMGAATMPTSGGDGITNMAQIVYQTNAHHFAVRGVVLHDLERVTSTTGTDLIGEIGLLYGRTREVGWGRIALAGGVSGIAFDACPDDDDSCFTIGVPLVAELARNGEYVGIGVQAFANFNAKASYAGGVFFLQLGRLR